MSPDAGSSNDRYKQSFKLAGSPCWILGVYTINAAQMIFDEQMPTKIATVGTISEEGIDEQKLHHLPIWKKTRPCYHAACLSFSL